MEFLEVPVGEFSFEEIENVAWLYNCRVAFRDGDYVRIEGSSEDIDRFSMFWDRNI